MSLFKIITFICSSFKLRRYLKTENDSRNVYSSSESVTLRSDKRHLMYRLSVFSLDDNGRVLSKGETSINTVSLNENEVYIPIYH